MCVNVKPDPSTMPDPEKVLKRVSNGWWGITGDSTLYPVPHSRDKGNWCQCLGIHLPLIF